MRDAHHRLRRWRRSFGWGAGIALLALMPKCLLCAVAWLGLGAALGLVRPEICGAAPIAMPTGLWPGLAVLGAPALYCLRKTHRLWPAKS